MNITFDTNSVIALDEAGSPHTAEALLAVSTDSHEDRSAVAEAADFLRGQLGAGPVDFRVLKREAAAAEIALPTLRRAKARLRVESAKCGQPGAGRQRMADRLEGWLSPTPTALFDSRVWGRSDRTAVGRAAPAVR